MHTHTHLNTHTHWKSVLLSSQLSTLNMYAATFYGASSSSAASVLMAKRAKAASKAARKEPEIHSACLLLFATLAEDRKRAQRGRLWAGSSRAAKLQQLSAFASCQISLARAVPRPLPPSPAHPAACLAAAAKILLCWQVRGHRGCTGKVGTGTQKGFHLRPTCRMCNVSVQLNGQAKALQNCQERFTWHSGSCLSTCNSRRCPLLLLLLRL